MFYKIGESDGNISVSCKLCHTEIMINENTCRKRGIYYTISENMICPKCGEKSNRIIDDPKIRAAMESNKKELALKEKELEEAKALKEKKLEEARVLREKEIEKSKAQELTKILNKKIIESEASTLLTDSEMKLILNNFINILDINFLSITSFVVFERLIIKHTNIGELSLLCNDPYLNHYLTYNSIYEGMEDYLSITLIENEFNEKFMRLVKLIIKKYMMINEDIAVFVTWTILRQFLNEYYHDLLLMEFEDRFNNNGTELSLDEYLSFYVKNDSINVNFNTGVLTHFLIHKGITYSQNFIKEYEVVVNLVLKSIENKKDDSFERALLKNNLISSIATYSIDDIDLMTGYEFEQFVSDLFKKMGYTTQLTKASGDQELMLLQPVREGKLVSKQNVILIWLPIRQYKKFQLE